MNTKEIFVIDLETKFRTPDDLREVSQKLNDYAADLNSMAREMEREGVTELNLKMNTMIYHVQTVWAEKMTKVRATFDVAMQQFRHGKTIGQRVKRKES